MKKVFFYSVFLLVFLASCGKQKAKEQTDNEEVAKIIEQIEQNENEIKELQNQEEELDQINRELEQLLKDMQ